MQDSALNLSTDMAVSMAKNFLRNMAQPLESDPLGVSIWNEAHVSLMQRDNEGV